MYSDFYERMENYEGDLADIVLASRVTASNCDDPTNEWQFPLSDPTNYEATDDFGDPFSNMRDPLLHDLDMSSSTGFFSNSADHLMRSSGYHEDHITSSTSCSGSSHTSAILAHQKIDDHEMRRPCNIFSRMLQISTTSANNNDLSLPISLPCEPPVITASSSSSSAPRGLVGSDHMLNKVERGGVQISSPRNPGIKRRKSQAKKVVCIPAPAAANSRPSGEVVPSDLWAWRKYGQKPIKGSPYPRGYYRCSSSKGCPARKQVERSRTDPNMLVITYTSEHNHPWPTQRNALAGSTRSQPEKNTSNSKNSPNSQSHKQSSGLKEEQHKENASSDIVAPAGGGDVKEEMEDIEKQLEIEEGEFSEGFHQSYKPTMPDQSNQQHQSEDFFADLGELEGDPLDLLFAQGFTSDHDQGHEGESQGIDPFSIFDWTSNNNTTTTTSFGEAKRAR
ncbi:WRKY domain [Dillenia turbinata]|uniref:WRKY domain n=1 Tax=Dillenia turbinata TaxID=194707 RepID=A0AAN8YVQ0_9MAGN